MTGGDAEERTVREQLEIAVRDLWTMLEEAGDDFATFMDRRRMRTRVWRDEKGAFHVSWEDPDGSWIEYSRSFAHAREAAFHAYQGPH